MEYQVWEDVTHCLDAQHVVLVWRPCSPHELVEICLSVVS
jgi:hypothetical protein